MLRALLAWLAIVTGLFAGEPGPVPEKLREELKLDKHYQRHVDAGGLPVVGSAKVSDNAIAEAAWIVGKMLGGKPEIVKAMAGQRVRVGVMAATEYTTDLPEHARLQTKLYWDRRARGLGATPRNPVVSCGEENLLDHPGDPYPNENIFVHEFAHAIHGTGLNKTDPTFDGRLRESYRTAMDRKLWANTYAATNVAEYWAEGVQSWFDDNAPPDALHNAVRTRAKLKDYDAPLAKLCEEVFGDGTWRYQRPAKRKAEDRAHLKHYDPQLLPWFRWRSTPVGEKARVTVQTAAGDFEVELDAKGVPQAVDVFLAIALDGGYHSGRFHRAKRDDKDPVNGFAGAEPKANWYEDASKRIQFPKVPATKRKPGSDSIALARDGKTFGSFAVFAGMPAEPDANLVPIGKVVKGLDAVRAILKLPLDGESIQAPVEIRRIIRTE